MRYKGHLLKDTPKPHKVCNNLIDLIEQELGLDITHKTRYRKYVYARKIYYKILYIDTKLSLASMGRSLVQTHATVLHALNNFDWDYNNDLDFKADFDKILRLYQGMASDDSIEELMLENTKIRKDLKDLKETILELQNSFSVIKEELGNNIKVLQSNSIQPRNQQTTIYQAS